MIYIYIQNFEGTKLHNIIENGLRQRSLFLYKKHSVQDATDAQKNMQAKACEHQRAKSCRATL